MKLFVTISNTVVADVSQHPYLITNGVSTCICLMVKGTMGGVGYIGMHHWDGFDLSFNKHAPNAEKNAMRVINELISNLSNAVLEEMRQYAVLPTERPGLDAFITVGGERANEQEALSGTELEVESLNRYAKKFCSRYFATSVDTQFTNMNYKTSGSDDMSLIFSFDGLEIIQPGLGDSIDDYDVGDSDDEDDVSEASFRP